MAEDVVIVDYGSGNLRSVEKALARAAREGGHSAVVKISADPALIAKADRIILPGVGAFGACMAGLQALDGAIAALEHAVLIEARPFLGICVGMQLLADQGLEFGEHQGLGWIAGKVRPIEARPGRRTPHMGWNEVAFDGAHAVFQGGPARDYYFAHSYHFVPENASSAAGVTDYDGVLVSAVARDNILGVQFHPEKSQDAGIALLGGFLKWRP